MRFRVDRGHNYSTMRAHGHCSVHIILCKTAIIGNNITPKCVAKQ